MATEGNQTTFDFHPLGSREIVGRFDGGTIGSDGGGVLLREVELRTGTIRQFATCFTDRRPGLFVPCGIVAQVNRGTITICRAR